MQRPTVLQTNATTVYQFLSIIRHRLEEGETLEGRRILDCGAGGPVPPVAIFAEQGMEAHGIDSNGRQLEHSKRFCSETGLDIRLKLADMRSLPYEDEFFDYVYEHYSVCHLTAEDTQRTVDEFKRVLKPGGIALLGVISKESWPQSRFGRRVDGTPVHHGLFSDAEANMLVDGWDGILREKVVRILTKEAETLSEQEWLAFHPEAPRACSKDEWMRRYPHRTDYLTYVHSFYYLRKP